MRRTLNILLMGARSSGKTTVGRRLAALRGGPFVDLDEAALHRLGAESVAAVWSAEGEPAWRAAESEALVDVLEEQGQVVALGGGTPMIPRAAERMFRAREAGRAILIHLSCPAEVLAARLARNTGDRPSLTGAAPADEIARVLAEREPTYRGLADLEVDTGTGTPGDAARTILEWENGRGRSSAGR